MAELKGRSSQFVYASGSQGLFVNLKGNQADVLLRGEKGKSLFDNIFFASNNIKLASNHVLRASNGLIWKPKQRGLRFTGSTDRVLITNTGLGNNLSSFTMSAWIKPASTAPSSWRCAIHKGTSSSVGDSHFWLGVNSSNQYTATICSPNSPGTYNAGSTGVTVTYNQWAHLCACWDGSFVRVYLNGELKKTYNLASMPNQIAISRLTTSNDAGTTYKFYGDVDDVRFYSRSLDQDEVLDIMYNEAIGNETGLLAYLDLNEALGTTANDKAGGTYDGTIYGATYFTEI